MRQKYVPSECVDVADRAMKELTDDSRTAFCSKAVELYLMGNRLDKARQLVDDYRQQMRQQANPSQATQDALAVLDSRVAIYEKKPYVVINRLEPLIARDVQDPEAWRLLAQGYEMAGQHQRSLQLLETLVTRWPGEPVATAQLAEMYFKMKRWQDAYAYARSVEDMMAGNLNAKLRRLRTQVNWYIDQPPKPEAIAAVTQELAQLRERYPKNVEVRTLDALMAIQQGHLDESHQIAGRRGRRDGLVDAGADDAGRTIRAKRTSGQSRRDVSEGDRREPDAGPAASGDGRASDNAREVGRTRGRRSTRRSRT